MATTLTLEDQVYGTWGGPDDPTHGPAAGPNRPVATTPPRRRSDGLTRVMVPLVVCVVVWCGGWWVLRQAEKSSGGTN